MNPSKTILQLLVALFLFSGSIISFFLHLTSYSTPTTHNTSAIEQQSIDCELQQPSIDCELQLIDEEIRLTKIIIKLTDEFIALPDTAKTKREELLELSRAMKIRHDEIIYLLNEEEKN